MGEQRNARTAGQQQHRHPTARPPQIAAAPQIWVWAEIGPGRKIMNYKLLSVCRKFDFPSKSKFV